MNRRPVGLVLLAAGGLMLGLGLLALRTPSASALQVGGRHRDTAMALGYLLTGGFEVVAAAVVLALRARGSARGALPDARRDLLEDVERQPDGA